METIKMKYDDETLPGVWCAVDIRAVNEPSRGFKLSRPFPCWKGLPTSTFTIKNLHITMLRYINKVIRCEIGTQTNFIINYRFKFQPSREPAPLIAFSKERRGSTGTPKVCEVLLTALLWIWVWRPARHNDNTARPYLAGGGGKGEKWHGIFWTLGGFKL